jgi:hypothetical protein
MALAGGGTVGENGGALGADKCVLKHVVPPVRMEPPTGRLDNFMIVAECGRAGDEIQDGLRVES